MAILFGPLLAYVGVVVAADQPRSESPRPADVVAQYSRAVAEASGYSVLASRSAPSEPPPAPNRLPTPETASLQVLPPNRYKIEVLRMGKVVETLVSDGVQQRVWNAKFFTVNVAPRKLRFVSPDIEWAEKAYWPLTLFTSSALVEHLVATTVTLEALAGKPAHRLHGATHLEAGALLLDLWLDASSHLPRKLIVNDGQGAITMNFEVTMTPPAPDTFVAHPPDGLLRRKQEPEYPRVATGKAAPAFSLKTPGGKATPLASLKNKVVLLDFWATWCPACKLVSPFLDHLQRSMGSRGLQVLGIATMSPPADLTEYLQSHTPAVAILHDPADEEQTVGYAKYQISGLPSFVLVNTQGRVERAWKYYWPGATETRLLAYIEDALEGTNVVPSKQPYNRRRPDRR
jgi:thiol-disulfide isomerase/thioredoxin